MLSLVDTSLLMPSVGHNYFFSSTILNQRGAPPMESFVGYLDYLRVIPFALEPELAT